MLTTPANSTIELEQTSKRVKPALFKHDMTESQRTMRLNASSGSPSLLDENGNSEPCATSATAVTEGWNESRTNAFRLVASVFCFMVMGANDSAYGPLIPYLEKYYNLTCYTTAYIIIALYPPYIVLVLAFILAGCGNGVADAAWNAWVGNLDNSSELSGFLHAFYGVGGVVSPLIATALITKANLEWYAFYYIMIGLASTETIALASAFWSSSGAEYRRIYKTNELEKEVSLTEALFRMPFARVSWVAAFYLLCYVGVEVALGGWVVVFMLRVRHGEPFASGMSAVGFWLSITVGRAVLGFATPRIGVKLATALYIGAAGSLKLIFWLVPQFYIYAVAVSFQGFFMGPLFPNAILVAGKLLPRQHHVVVIGFAAAFGGCGAAVLPFLTGILAEAQGPKVLQPIVLALLVITLGIWFCFPSTSKMKE
ncbi:hypothetical protein TrVFT333_011862 [Trichoderma virens FT-333]|nr:hypothetical protein TrVFT333_011862 [Trichoderma virens FT-333]